MQSSLSNRAPDAGGPNQSDAGAEPYRVLVRGKEFASPDGTAVTVISGLSLELPVGAFSVLVGPSGCGKTTTLKIIMGLDTDFDGEVDARLATARLAAAFQEPRLLPWRTVAQNVALAVHDLPKARRAAAVAEALSEVGLDGLGDRYPSQLSLGQMRRAALARAFVVRPDVLFLDEPFVSLDEASAQRLRQLLLALWQRHPVSVLMVTHNVREAVQLADRIVILSDRPTAVAGEVDVAIARDARTSDAVSAFAADLAQAFPGLVTV